MNILIMGEGTTRRFGLRASKPNESKEHPDKAPDRPESTAAFMSRVEAFERSRKVHPAPLWLLFAFVLLLPQFFGVTQGQVDYRALPLLENIGYASVYIADEPHYMTINSSLINSPAAIGSWLFSTRHPIQALF